MQCILQVQAFDSDFGDHGDIRYTKLSGDSSIVEGLRLDPVTGEISVVNNHFLDREALDSKILNIN